MSCHTNIIELAWNFPYFILSFRPCRDDWLWQVQSYCKLYFEQNLGVHGWNLHTFFAHYGGHRSWSFMMERIVFPVSSYLSSSSSPSHYFFWKIITSAKPVTQYNSIVWALSINDLLVKLDSEGGEGQMDRQTCIACMHVYKSSMTVIN